MAELPFRVRLTYHISMLYHPTRTRGTMTTNTYIDRDIVTWFEDAAKSYAQALSPIHADMCVRAARDVRDWRDAVVADLEHLAVTAPDGAAIWAYEHAARLIKGESP